MFNLREIWCFKIGEGVWDPPDSRMPRLNDIIIIINRSGVGGDTPKWAYLINKVFSTNMKNIPKSRRHISLNSRSFFENNLRMSQNCERDATTRVYNQNKGTDHIYSSQLIVLLCSDY